MRPCASRVIEGASRISRDNARIAGKASPQTVVLILVGLVVVFAVVILVALVVATVGFTLALVACVCGLVEKLARMWFVDNFYKNETESAILLDHRPPHRQAVPPMVICWSDIGNAPDPTIILRHPVAQPKLRYHAFVR